MKRPFVCFMAVAIGMVVGGTADAQDAPQQRGYQYFAPQRSISQRALTTTSAQQSATGLPRAAAAPGQVVPYSPSARQTAVGGTGVRYVANYGYRPSLFGRLVQGPRIERIEIGSPRNPVPIAVAQATGLTPPAAGYTAPPASGYTSTGSATPPAAGSAPVSGNPGPMYGTIEAGPMPGGISSIYAYSGRAYGPYYSNGMLYYGYGGSNGWGSPYNSVYYNSGCYNVNACCRAPRRLCTPFGGMAYGCGRGCYVVTPPTCPTVCAPYGSSILAPGVAPHPTYAPTPTNGSQPQPMPPKPEPPDETPAPPEPSVKPDPQASNVPQVPVFPRIPDLPET
jgi:hypothetical protein